LHEADSTLALRLVERTALAKHYAPERSAFSEEME
jgi:hypothetical protein